MATRADGTLRAFRGPAGNSINDTDARGSLPDAAIASLDLAKQQAAELCGGGGAGYAGMPRLALAAAALFGRPHCCRGPLTPARDPRPRAEWTSQNAAHESWVAQLKCSSPGGPRA